MKTIEQLKPDMDVYQQFDGFKTIELWIFKIETEQVFEVLQIFDYKFD